MCDRIDLLFFFVDLDSKGRLSCVSYGYMRIEQQRIDKTPLLFGLAARLIEIVTR